MLQSNDLVKNGLILVLVPVLLELASGFAISGALYSSQLQMEKIRAKSDGLIEIRRHNLNIERTMMLSDDPELTSSERNLQIGNCILGIVEAEKDARQEGRAAYGESVEPLIGLYSDIRQTLQNILQTRDSKVLDGAQKSYFDSANAERLRLIRRFRAVNQELGKSEERFESEQLDVSQRSYLTLVAIVCLIGLINIAGLFWLVVRFCRGLDQRISGLFEKAKLSVNGEELFFPNSLVRDEISAVDDALRESALVLADSRRKESAILDNAADVICSLDAKLRFRAVGAAVMKLWQFSPEELLGMSLLTLIESEQLDSVRAEFGRIQQSGEGELENVIFCKDGKPKNLLWTISWSETEGNYFCVVHDVTELRAIEKLKRRFIAIVSHDLRTPLTSVGVCLTFLLSGRRGHISPEVRKLLELAQRSASRLMDLVNELLELEKLGAGKFLLNPICVSISDVCAAAKENLQNTAETEQIRLRGPVGDALIYADQDRLVQVVTNLLANGIRYSSAGSTVNLAIVKDAGQFVELRVTDAGPPISPEERGSVFDKFQRQTVLSGAQVKNTGLGLAIVKAIVEAHGGQVGVEPQIHTGNVFWITLPKYRDDEEDEEV